MTLVITELSKYGIAMVADSAVTEVLKLPSGRTIARVLTGVRKLQVIPYLGAGISVWGLGSILLENTQVPTDLWLNDFIERHSGTGSIDEFAKRLTEELRSAVGMKTDALGFHLAGYVEVNSKRLPTFYHVRNVEGDFVSSYSFHEFVPGHDMPPREFDDEILTTRNGDYGPYALLVKAVENALPAIKTVKGLTIPHSSLQGRVAYLAAWVRFVSDLYASSGVPRTIGGDVAALGITPDGQIMAF